MKQIFPIGNLKNVHNSRGKQTCSIFIHLWQHSGQLAVTSYIMTFSVVVFFYRYTMYNVSYLKLYLASTFISNGYCLRVFQLWHFTTSLKIYWYMYSKILTFFLLLLFLTHPHHMPFLFLRFKGWGLSPFCEGADKN